MKLKKFIGKKEFYKETISIALPIMVQQFVTSFVNLIDNIMIGSVGATALTSVSIANKYYTLFNSTLIGFCGAAGIFIAQYYGAKENNKCQKIFDISLVFGLIVGLIYMLIASIMPEFIIGLFTRTPEIMNMGLDYISIIRFSFIPNALSLIIMSALRSVGINKLQVKIGLVTVATNTFLNYCLILGHLGFPALGVKGAAIATLIARLVEMMIYSIILFRKKHFFSWNIKGILHLDLSLMKNVFFKAIPLTYNEIMFSLGLTMIFKSYMRVDEYLIAAVTVVDTVINIAYIIFSGLSSAVSIMIGKRLGANQLEEAKDNSLKLLTFGALVGVCVSVILFIAAKYVPLLYNLEEDINTTITTLLRIKAILIPLYVINVCIFFTLRAGGDVKSTIIMDSGYLWGVSVLLSTVLSIFVPMSLINLYIIVESLEAIKMIVAIHYYRKGTWVNNLTTT